MSAPGIRVNRGNFSSTVDILCFSTKLDDMNECDAPESNNIVARAELTRNFTEHYAPKILSLLRINVVNADLSK